MRLVAGSIATAALGTLSLSGLMAGSRPGGGAPEPTPARHLSTPKTR